MKIDPATNIHGVPILVLRSALRRNQHHSHTAPGFANLLGVPEAAVGQLLQNLVNDGLLMPVEAANAWENTVAGNALANAAAGKKISRATAEKALKQLIARASTVNQTPAYAFVVARIHVFGSYLSTFETLSDVDVFIELRKRHADPARQAALEEEVKQRLPRTGDLIADLYRAEREVWKFLKAGSRTIQVAQSMPEGANSAIVFEETAGPVSPRP